MTTQRKLKVGDVVYFQSDFDGTTPMVVTDAKDGTASIVWTDRDGTAQRMILIPEECFVLAVDEEEKKP